MSRADCARNRPANDAKCGLGQILTGVPVSGTGVSVAASGIGPARGGLERILKAAELPTDLIALAFLDSEVACTTRRSRLGSRRTGRIG